MVVGNGPLKLNVKCLSLNELRNNIVVCDGGDTDSDAIKEHMVFTVFVSVRVIYE